MGCIFSSLVIFPVGCLNHNNGGLIALCLLTGEILIHSSGGEHYAATAAKSLQSCPTLCDLIDAAHQAPPSLGFSRQEHWSGLPFPSPMHESEKWKRSRWVVSMSDSSRPHGLQPTRLLHPWDFSRREYWSGVPAVTTYCQFDKLC